VGLQIVHLVFSDLIWIALVLLSASVLAEPQPERVPARAGSGQAARAHSA